MPCPGCLSTRVISVCWLEFFYHVEGLLQVLRLITFPVGDPTKQRVGGLTVSLTKWPSFPRPSLSSPSTVSRFFVSQQLLTSMLALSRFSWELLNSSCRRFRCCRALARSSMAAFSSSYRVSPFALSSFPSRFLERIVNECHITWGRHHLLTQIVHSRVGSAVLFTCCTESCPFSCSRFSVGPTSPPA